MHFRFALTNNSFRKKAQEIILNNNYYEIFFSDHSNHKKLLLPCTPYLQEIPMLLFQHPSLSDHAPCLELLELQSEPTQLYLLARQVSLFIII